MPYIDKELIEKLKTSCIAKYPLSYIDGILAFAKEIAEMPTADVAEVKHGYWIDLNITEWQCSECNYRVERWNNTPYCPDCGAKMDGGNAE